MKDRLKQLSSDFALLAKRELSSAQDVVDKTLTSAVDVGVESKNSITSAFDRSVDLLNNVVEPNQAKSILEKAKNLAHSSSDQAMKYAAHISDLGEEVLESAEIIIPQKESAEELGEVIEKLKGKDKVGLIGEVLAATGGGAAGAAAAGTIASAAGASTIFGSASLASVLGGTLVASTPVGWVVGSVVVAGAAGYGIAKLVRSGSRQDQIREQLIKRFEARLDQLEKSGVVDSEIQELNALLFVVIKKGIISVEQADRMRCLVEKGTLRVEIALERLKSMENSRS